MSGSDLGADPGSVLPGRLPLLISPARTGSALGKMAWSPRGRHCQAGGLERDTSPSTEDRGHVGKVTAPLRTPLPRGGRCLLPNSALLSLPQQILICPHSSFQPVKPAMFEPVRPEVGHRHRGSNFGKAPTAQLFGPAKHLDRAGRRQPDQPAELPRSLPALHSGFAPAPQAHPPVSEGQPWGPHALPGLTPGGVWITSEETPKEFITPTRSHDVPAQRTWRPMLYREEF